MISTLKHILFDVLFLYRHFLNWNIHKILAHATGLLYSLVVTVIFALIYFIIAKIGGFSEVNLFALLTGSIGENLFVIGYQYVVLILFGIVFFFTHILLANIYFSYIKKEKLPYLKNRYFDLRLLKQYMVLALGILVLAFVFFSLYLLIVRMMFGDALQVVSVSQSIAAITLGLFVLVFLTFLYILYRFVFSFAYIIQEQVTLRSALQKSWKATKGGKKIFMTMIVVLFFSTIILPFKGVEKSLSLAQREIQEYTALMLYDTTDGSLSTIEQAKLEAYDLQFGERELAELTQIYASLTVFRQIFFVFFFLFFTGYCTMLYVSIFSRIIEPNNKNLG